MFMEKDKTLMEHMLLVMCVFANQRLNNEPLTIRGDGEQRRDFTYVGMLQMLIF